jgi:hypothetical protein
LYPPDQGAGEVVGEIDEMAVDVPRCRSTGTRLLSSGF